MKTEPKKRVGKPQSVTPESPNLASTWRSIATRNRTLKDALAEMNQVLGMKITNSRFAEWEQDLRAPRSPVVNYMLSEVIPVLLNEIGAEEDVSSEILGKIRIPGV